MVSGEHEIVVSGLGVYIHVFDHHIWLTPTCDIHCQNQKLLIYSACYVLFVHMFPMGHESHISVCGCVYI